MKARALIFDFDGTLAVLNLDFDLMKQRVRALARQRGLKAPFPQGYLLEALDQVATVLGNGFRQEALALIESQEVEAAADARPFDFTPGLLARARRAGFGLAVITRNCGAAVRRVVPGLAHMVDAFLPRELAPKPKPHPDHVLAACRALGVEPFQAVMVGDHPTDMEGAKAAGALAVGVTTGRMGAADLAAAGADLVLPDAGALLAVVRFAG